MSVRVYIQGWVTFLSNSCVTSFVSGFSGDQRFEYRSDDASRIYRTKAKKGRFERVSFTLIIYINWMIINVYILMRYITRNAFKTKRYRHDRNDDCIFPIDRRSFVSRISQGGTLNITKIRTDCVPVHVSTDFVSFLYITLTYRVDLFLIHWRSFLHSRVKDRTENREKQWKTVEILCSSRNFLEEVEFTDVVGSFSFYLCRINASENFNINASHISNDVCKVWRTLIRWKWRYWLTRACFLQIRLVRPDFAVDLVKCRLWYLSNE